MIALHSCCCLCPLSNTSIPPKTCGSDLKVHTSIFPRFKAPYLHARNLSHHHTQCSPALLATLTHLPLLTPSTTSSLTSLHPPQHTPHHQLHTHTRLTFSIHGPLSSSLICHIHSLYPHHPPPDSLKHLLPTHIISFTTSPLLSRTHIPRHRCTPHRCRGELLQEGGFTSPTPTTAPHSLTSWKIVLGRHQLPPPSRLA